MLNASEIAGMRETSASALPDTCVIARAVGEPELDETTGDADPPAPVTIYTGPCRVRPRDTQAQDVEIGNLHDTTADYVATLPHDAAGIEVDDFLTVTVSIDSDMVGRSFRITHVGWSSWQIDRRLTLEDREQPPGVTSS